MLRIVLASSNAADLAVARSILGAVGVEYVVRNEHALLIPLVHATELLVDEDDAEKATEMLRHAGLLA